MVPNRSKNRIFQPTGSLLIGGFHQVGLDVQGHCGAWPGHRLIKLVARRPGLRTISLAGLGQVAADEGAAGTAKNLNGL